jgi:hypothetical protein
MRSVRTAQSHGVAKSGAPPKIPTWQIGLPESSLQLSGQCIVPGIQADRVAHSPKYWRKPDLLALPVTNAVACRFGTTRTAARCAQFPVFMPTSPSGARPAGAMHHLAQIRVAGNALHDTPSKDTLSPPAYRSCCCRSSLEQDGVDRFTVTKCFSGRSIFSIQTRRACMNSPSRQQSNQGKVQIYMH